MNRRSLLACAALCALLAPASAWAVTEGVVESAPPVMLELGGEREETSYLPQRSMVYDDDGAGMADMQTPCLTAEEIARAKRLMEEAASGLRSGDGAALLEAKEPVALAVYALDPAEYDGERAYVLLPSRPLTDEELLGLVDAFDRLGLRFDPEGLSGRNCTRGGLWRATRYLTTEEGKRSRRMRLLVRRGVLGTGEQALKSVRTDPKEYAGMRRFIFLPYRSLTDEELLAELALDGEHDESGGADLEQLEARSRRALGEQLGCPMSMELYSLSGEGWYIPAVFTPEGERDWEVQQRRGRYALFSYEQDGMAMRASAHFDAETGELAALEIMERAQKQDVPWERTASDERCLRAALGYAEDVLGFRGLAMHLDGDISADWGMCVRACAMLSGERLLTVYVGWSDGEVHGAGIENLLKAEETDQ